MKYFHPLSISPAKKSKYGASVDDIFLSIAPQPIMYTDPPENILFCVPLYILTTTRVHILKLVGYFLCHLCTCLWLNHRFSSLNSHFMHLVLCTTTVSGLAPFMIHVEGEEPVRIVLVLVSVGEFSSLA